MSSSRRTARPHKREGFWYLVRRVPAQYAALDKRGIVRVSTGIRICDDPRAVTAQREVQRLDAELAKYWRDLAAGRDPEGIKRSRWAAETANRFGFPYVELADLNVGPLVDLVKRLLAVESLRPAEREKVLPALWGHYPKPVDGTLLSEMAEAYQTIHATALMRKSEEQRHKWRVQRDRAQCMFIEIIGGDKRLVDLTADDVDTVRDYWKKRILAGEIAVNTANKNIGRVAAMFREISEERKLKLEDLFARSQIKGGEDKKRVPFEIAYVQNVLLADGVMDGLNDEARAIFYVVAELGMRPSEVAGLRRSTILLDHEIPHVNLAEEGRTLKNKNSRRKLPLVGVALEVMKHFPDGFPRYRSRTASLSTVVNKYLQENGLCPKQGQSFYSLRHTFKDRLRAVDWDEELRDVLMGHATDKEDYGDGHSLKRKQEVLLRMAFKPPRLDFAEGVGREIRDHRAARARLQSRAGGKWGRKLRRDRHAAPRPQSGPARAAPGE